MRAWSNQRKHSDAAQVQTPMRKSATSASPLLDRWCLQVNRRQVQMQRRQQNHSHPRKVHWGYGNTITRGQKEASGCSAQRKRANQTEKS